MTARALSLVFGFDHRGIEGKPAQELKFPEGGFDRLEVRFLPDLIGHDPDPGESDIPGQFPDQSGGGDVA